VHDPFEPKAELMKKYERFATNKYVQQYYAMLDNLDQQVGRLVSAIERSGQAHNTLFVVLSDNGPTAWPYYYRERLEPPGRTGGLRGRKWSLYEGGIRTPLIARWDGRIPAGRTDSRTVVSAVDLFPTCCALSGVRVSGATKLDGEDLSRAFRGRPMTRRGDLMWDYGRTADMQRPGLPIDQSPNLAIRSGDWKLLMNDDGSNVELYDFSRSEKEDRNVAAEHAELTKRLSQKLIGWRKSLPVMR
jgi:arylsulfatase A-like enzyme